MNKQELVQLLRDMANEIHDQDKAAQVEKLTRDLNYYKNALEQTELKVIMLEVRLAEIRNLLNGSIDNARRGAAE